MKRSCGAAVIVTQHETEADMKQLMLAAVIAVAGTSASLAQDVYARPGYGSYGQSYYDYSPGNSYGPRYGYPGGYNNYGYSRDDERGGPGPRVGPGSGMGIGSQR
jgi:opacity protein-like surface antigen